MLAPLPIELLSLRDVPHIEPLAEETGQTFEANARQKASYYASASGMLTLAEDSGLLVDALPGELGVFTRRWGAGEKATDQEWITYFLQRMERETNRGAEFVCTAALDDGKLQHIYTGVCRGSITPTLDQGYLPGLPLTGCFVPEGFTTVFSRLTLEQKNACSHRGRAMQQVFHHLSALAEARE